MSHREKQFYIKEQNKRLRALYNRRKELLRLQGEQVEYIELKPPLRDGWIRSLEIRSDIRKNWQIGGVLKEALQVINHWQFCSNKKFFKKNWKTQKMEPMVFDIHPISPQKYEGLSDRVKVYFSKRTRVTHWGVYDSYVCNVSKWMFTFKILPHYIRYLMVPNETIEKELEQINGKLRSENLWPKIGKIYGWRNHYDEWDLSLNKERMFSKIQLQEMQEEITKFGTKKEVDDYQYL